MFAFEDNDGMFLATGQTLFHGFGSYARRREFYEEELTTTKRISHFNRQIVVGLKKGTIECSLDPKDPQFRAHVTNALKLAYDVFGQRTLVTIFGAVYPAPTEREQMEVVDMVAAAINDAGMHTVFYVEMANEGWTNGFKGDEGRDRLFRLCARFTSKCRTATPQWRKPRKPARRSQCRPRICSGATATARCRTPSATTGAFRRRSRSDSFNERRGWTPPT